MISPTDNNATQYHINIMILLTRGNPHEPYLGGGKEPAPAKRGALFKVTLESGEFCPRLRFVGNQKKNKI